MKVVNVKYDDRNLELHNIDGAHAPGPAIGIRLMIIFMSVLIFINMV